jgi:hypothetical protein
MFLAFASSVGEEFKVSNPGRSRASAMAGPTYRTSV